MMSTVTSFHTERGSRIYRIPLEVFPGLWGHAHLVCTEAVTALVDVGSGFGSCNEQLEAGLAAVRGEHGEAVDWATLSHILVTHGHIDHFGGLAFVRQRCAAPVGVHPLDRTVLTNYEERLSVISRRLGRFLAEAGVLPAQREELMALYRVNKALFASIPVDFVYQEAEDRVGSMRILHVPGHCPGQVVIRVDEVLLSSDHVLPETTPHQAPESLCPYTGLGHYLESLDRLLDLAGGIRLTLGGHEAEMTDLPGRVGEIRAMHAERLASVLDLMEVPHTIAELAQALFPDAGGYHVLLALEEAGAHVEYLAQRGCLGIDNLGELESEDLVPIRYHRLPDTRPIATISRPMAVGAARGR
jgi:glyoxylase-like metal-dependent hydrolase (beta-lactamase superfamily II)